MGGPAGHFKVQPARNCVADLQHGVASAREEGAPTFVCNHASLPTCAAHQRTTTSGPLLPHGRLPELQPEGRCIRLRVSVQVVVCTHIDTRAHK